MRLFLSLVLAVAVGVVASAEEIADVTARVYFSPNGGAMAAVIEQIDGAQESIFVQAYSFTARPIADALIRAKARGVDVRVILDSEQPAARGGQYLVLVAAGVPVQLDDAHAIAHDKVMILDGERTITGHMPSTAKWRRSQRIARSGR